MFLSPFLRVPPAVFVRPRTSVSAGTNSDEVFGNQTRRLARQNRTQDVRLHRHVRCRSNKKDLSFEKKDRSCTCGATFFDSEKSPLTKMPTHFLPLTQAHGPDTRVANNPFPFPSANHLPSSFLRDSQQRPLSVSAHDGLTLASSV